MNHNKPRIFRVDKYKWGVEFLGRICYTNKWRNALNHALKLLTDCRPCGSAPFHGQRGWW